MHIQSADDRVVGIRLLNPTLSVFVGVYLAYILLFLLALTSLEFHPILHPAIFVAQVLLTILMFTPLHDAVHRSVSRIRWINDLVLHGVWPLFLNAPFIFKIIHMTHHAHTNDGERDPDHFTSSKTWVGRWVKSFLLILSYYHFAVKFFPKTPLNLFWMALSLASFGGTAIGIWFTPWAIPLFFAWVLPAFVGIGILGFLNTAWPHHPGDQTSKIKNTKILLVPKFLEWLLLFQNYHLLHHLRPTMPWYEYRAYWHKHRERLVNEGAEVLDYRELTR